MKLELLPRDDHQVKIIAEFEPDIFNQYKERATRKFSKQAKVPGFRPGKVPPSIIQRMYGDEAIEHEAIELLVDGEYSSILKEAKIEPGAAGSLDEIISSNPPKLSFVVPLQPTIEIGDYHSIRQDYQLEPITEKEIDAFIQRMRTAYATAEPVDHSAQKGDLVYFRISGKKIKVKEGENAEVMAPTNQQLVIGESTLGDTDWPYKGFGDTLIGAEAGAVLSIKHKHPKSENEAELLRGQEIEYSIEIQSIKTLALPDLDDAFAKTAGNYENLESFRKAVRTSLETSAKRKYDDQYFDGIVSKLKDMATIKYPPQILDEEKGHVLDRVKEDLAEQKLDLETYLKTINKDHDTFVKEEIEPAARKRLEQSLILDKIAELEKIEVGKEELSKAFIETYQELSVNTDLKKIERQMSRDRLSKAIASQAASRLLSQHVLDRLKLIAIGEYLPEKSTSPTPKKKTATKKTTPGKMVKPEKKTPSIPKEKKPVIDKKD